jgi:hypothetical protein
MNSINNIIKLDNKLQNLREKKLKVSLNLIFISLF